VEAGELGRLTRVGGHLSGVLVADNAQPEGVLGTNARGVCVAGAPAAVWARLSAANGWRISRIEGVG
jgi:hypothetical protein